MAAVHSHAARVAGGRLVAIASSSPERAEAAARRYGFDSAAETVEALLEDESIDVVHICTPNSTHAVLARAVIAAGKHVICEKPLATSLVDATALVEAVGSGSLRSAVPFVYRYHPMVREARARISSGSTGAIVSIQGSYLQDWLLMPSDDDWRVDIELGGPSRAFADIGSHLCDLIEFVTGDRIDRLNAVKRTVLRDRVHNRNITTEDVVAVAFETGGGAIGTLLVSQVAPGRKNRLAIEISGATETIGFDQEQPETLWLGRRRGSEILPRDADQLSPDAARLSLIPAGHPLGYQDAFNGFVADAYRSVVGEVPEGLPTFDDGLRAVQVTEAVIESANRAGWLDVPSSEQSAGASK
jgi:predicted dehydrogenase